MSLLQSRIQAELSLNGAKCRGERHEQVIARQRDALVELRAKIRALDSGSVPGEDQLHHCQHHT